MNVSKTPSGAFGVDETAVPLTYDSFLRVLGLGGLDPRLGGPHKKAQLFRLTLEYLDGKQLLESHDGDRPSLGQLELRLPGTSFVVRLSEATQEELYAFVTVAFMLVTTGHVDVQSLTAVAVAAVVARTRRLRPQYGERSVVDALAQARRPTLGEALRILFGKPCRYPKSNCRFIDDQGGHCTLTIDQIEQIVADLAERKIVRRLNSVAPYEYGLVV